MKKTLCGSLMLFTLFFSPFLLHAQQKPNVLFIAIDDLSIVFDAYGNPEVPAPNVNRLMTHGTMFRRVYTQYALCSPSRATILSGKRPNSTGVINNGTSIRTKLGANYKFLPEYFESAGYYTGKFGKMTCGHEEEINWDYFYDSVPKDGVRDIGGEPHWWIDTASKSVMDNRYGLYTKALIKKMKEPRSVPYFFGFGIGVHNEFTPTLGAWNKLGDPAHKQLLPVDLEGTITNVRGNGSGNIILPNTPPDDESDIPPVAIKSQQVFPDDEWRNIRHAYYGEIVDMDSLLGVVLDELDRQNAWQNTVVVFLSDHGIQTGEHNGLWFKQTLFEEALRVPLIICAPGKSTGGIHESPVELVDVYSTLSELCGLPVPVDQEGTSLVPLLEKQNVPWKKAAFAQVRRVDRQGSSDTTLSDAVRTTRYHYNSWGTEGEELYDIDTDPYEYTNQINNPAYASALTEMRQLFAGNWQNAKPPVYPRRAYYRDADGDGYGSRIDSIKAYFAPAGYLDAPTDCNDTDPKINPGAKERPCNGVDDNCDNRIDETKKLPEIQVSGSLDICTTGFVTLATTGSADATYQWKRNGNAITKGTKRTYRATKKGAYTVVVTNSGSGCIAESVPTVVTNSCGRFADSEIAASDDDASALSESITSVKLSAFPNPSKGNITVRYNNTSNGSLQLKVYDMTGKTVYAKTEAVAKTGSTFNLDLSRLTPGTYFLEANNGANAQRVKVVIQR